MESKEIFAVILAVLAVIIVISVLSMVTRRGTTTQEDSAPAMTELPPVTAITWETDIWDVLREQNTTTVLTEEIPPEVTAESDIAEGTEFPADGTGLLDFGSTPTELPVTDESLPDGSET